MTRGAATPVRRLGVSSSSSASSSSASTNIAGIYPHGATDTRMGRVRRQVRGEGARRALRLWCAGGRRAPPRTGLAATPAPPPARARRNGRRFGRRTRGRRGDCQSHSGLSTATAGRRAGGRSDGGGRPHNGRRRCPCPREDRWRPLPPELDGAWDRSLLRPPAPPPPPPARLRALQACSPPRRGRLSRGPGERRSKRP